MFLLARLLLLLLFLLVLLLLVLFFVAVRITCSISKTEHLSEKEGRPVKVEYEKRGKGDYLFLLVLLQMLLGIGNLITRDDGAEY